MIWSILHIFCNAYERDLPVCQTFVTLGFVLSSLQDPSLLLSFEHWICAVCFFSSGTVSGRICQTISGEIYFFNKKNLYIRLIQRYVSNHI
ncbi:tRNA-modifying protein YgfZ [Trichinella pseudospiralis]